MEESIDHGLWRVCKVKVHVHVDIFIFLKNDWLLMNWTVVRFSASTFYV